MSISSKVAFKPLYIMLNFSVIKTFSNIKHF
jgi:hypothetical protein